MWYRGEGVKKPHQNVSDEALNDLMNAGLDFF